jgi:hypothetical protein
VEIIPAATGGGISSLAELAGFPGVVTYSAAPDYYLLYAVSSTPQGTNPADWSTVIAIPEVPWNMQLVLNSLDRPCIMYAASPDSSLAYAYCDTTTGNSSSDWHSLTVDSAAHSADYASMAIIDSKPMIAYYSGSSTADLRIAYSDTATGSQLADWHTFILQETGDVGQGCVLIDLNGAPAVAYLDKTSDTLMFMQSTTADGQDPSDWTDPEIVTSLPAGLFSNILGAAIGGRPALAYSIGKSYSLHYAVKL